ncbi:MAG: hypothetical protein SFV81_26345 [Pirellulaceae bacterium]|nr:hypothetical protein [Pirellulaceae bacterium]
MLNRCSLTPRAMPWLAWLIGFSFMLAGCAKEYAPVPAVAKEIKSGVSLEEIKRQLGEPHTPTAAQAKQLEEVISRMPEPMRINAQKDKSWAWGNDSSFFVAKVNDKGIAWVTGWRE